MRKLCGFFLAAALVSLSAQVTFDGPARATSATGSGTGDTSTTVGGTAGTGTVDVGSGTAEDAARQIAAAREQANAAAAAFNVAETKLDVVTDQKTAIDGQVAVLEKQVAALKKTVEAVAVNRYLGAGTTGIAVLSGNIGPTEQGQADVLVGIVTETSSSTLDDYDALRKKLDEKIAAAEQTAQVYVAAQADFEAKRKAADDEVERLKLVERGRLQDEAVQRALEAQRQKEIETQKVAAAAELKKEQAAAAAAAQSGGADGGDEGQGVSSGNQASSGSAGGTTGGGGSGGRPGIGTGIIYGQGDAWVCPIQGPTGFTDSFGAPRPNGRTHQGIDLISPAGTPEVAVVDGFAKAGSNELGGTVIEFFGNDGNRYYYAHLSAYGQLGEVAKGTVIGYVGQTGDAISSVPHLHFEIHPGGGPAVDPYATLFANC